MASWGGVGVVALGFRPTGRIWGVGWAGLGGGLVGQGRLGHGPVGGGLRFLFVSFRFFFVFLSFIYFLFF